MAGEKEKADAPKQESEKQAEAPKEKSPFQPIEDCAMQVVSALPVPYFGKWVSAYFHPAKVIEAEKENCSLSNVAINFLLAALVSGVVSFLIYLIDPAFSSLMVGAAEAALLSIIVAPVFSVILSLLLSGFIYLLARFLGGKGGYLEQTLGLALVYGGEVLFLVPLNFLILIPFVGGIFGLISVVVQLYALYGFYRVLKHVHELSPIRAAALIIVPVVLLLIVSFALAFLASAALIGAMATGAI